MWTYSLIWIEEERQPEQRGQQHPGLQAEVVAVLDRRLRPVHRQRRAQQDRGVDARDRDRQLVVAEREPVMALGHEADEEVGREEGPEDHDLRDDEEQHPEQLLVHPRAAVGLRRAMVVVVVVMLERDRRADSGGLHQWFLPAAGAARSGSATMCSTSMFEALRTREMRSARIQPERVDRQRRDDDPRHLVELEHVHRRRVRIGVADHAGDEQPLARACDRACCPAERGRPRRRDRRRGPRAARRR